MTRHKSLNKSKQRPSNQAPQNVLQSNRAQNELGDDLATRVEELSSLKSLLIDDEPSSEAGCSSDKSNSKTAALYDELDSFRQRWKRELGPNDSEKPLDAKSHHGTVVVADDGEKENAKVKSQSLTGNELYSAVSNPPGDPRDVYALAKKLFLTGVELEQDEAHHESIRYYKQAVHLCPDIERQIFREQCEASLKSCGINKQADGYKFNDDSASDVGKEDKDPLLDRISSSLQESIGTKNFRYCRPSHKHKVNERHISELPQDLLLLLARYVIGQELDLASLESLGLVCRGFFLLTRDSSLWRSVCFRTWGSNILAIRNTVEDKSTIDWRKLYLEKPRVNCDGVYISRTKYVRQGDPSFQDMAYRPFHVVRYYRYLRFFPDKRVLILTTSEEPERIIPIFRHALHAKQISELSILEGSYEFFDNSHIVIDAEKDFSNERNCSLHQHQHQTHHQRRKALFHWSRQTPISQRSNMKFELRTSESRPHRNNVLKWLEYTITTVLETGQEITTYDLSPDTFPNMAFLRVKKFNLRLTEPLSSH